MGNGVHVAPSGIQGQMLTQSVADHIIRILLDPSLPHFRVVLPQLILLLFQTTCLYGSLSKFLRLPGSEVPGIF